MVESLKVFPERERGILMELAIIYDNTSARDDMLSGWGFSCLVGGRVLFDTGEDYESLRSNLSTMGADIGRIEAVVLSHDHWDHTGGVEGFLREAGPGIAVYGCSDTERPLRKKISNNGGEFIEAESPTEIAQGIYTTGQINGSYKGSGIMEQSLAFKTVRGVSVVTGCSHPGIVKIVRRVKELFPGEDIPLVMGGFHLRDDSAERVHSIARKMRELGAEKAAPAHCSGDQAMDVFSDVYGDDYLSAGAGKVLEV